MPAWLRDAHNANDHATGRWRENHADAMAAATAAPVSPSMPEALSRAVPVASQPTAEASTDTTSFISETDLPEWLRNLAAADASKAEVTRIAQEAEAARQGTSRNDGKVENPGLEGLPGDAPFTPASSSSWLARGETVARPAGPSQREEIVTQASGGAGRRAAFADVVSAYTPRPTTHGEPALHDGEVIARATSPAKPAPVVETIEEQKTKTGRRVLLIVATLVAIVAMLLVAYALGATGV